MHTAAGNDIFLSDLPPMPQVADVTRLLSAEINRLRRMQADDLVRARAVGFLCNVILKSLEVGTLEERLAALEAAARAKGPKLRRTSDYMVKTYPGAYRDVAAGVKLRRHDPPRAELELEQAILPPARLREHRPMVYVWALLQGVAGLREKEAGYLREQDFDPAARTITIAATSAHKPKNRPSYRTIPAGNPRVAGSIPAPGTIKTSINLRACADR